jgi:insertion element IS1 protein InsB
MTLIRACPKCKSKHFIKNGKLHARQRYECKACGYNFTVSKLGKSKPPEVRRMALQLYLEGLSLRGIERLLKISHVTGLKWVRQWGKAIERLRREAEPKEVRQVEIDELCSYIGEKKQKWVWVGVDRERGKVLDFVVGDRSERTGRKLYERLKRYRVKRFYTDHWGSYRAMWPARLHKASKAETHSVERVNSLIRHD